MMKDCLLLSLFLYKNKDEGSFRRVSVVAAAAADVAVVVEVNNVLQLFSFPFTNHITKESNYYFCIGQIMVFPVSGYV